MRRLIKESEDRKERIADSTQTLIHIIEVNKKSKFIESIELGNVYTYDVYNTIECNIIVKGYCEDPDLGEFSKILKEIDNDIYRVVQDYEFDKEGNIKRCPDGDTYLMFMAESVNWSMRDNNIEIGFRIVQDDFRDDEQIDQKNIKRRTPGTRIYRQPLQGVRQIRKYEGSNN